MTPELEFKTIEDIKYICGVDADIPTDLIKMAGLLNLSVLPKNLDEMAGLKNALCVFVTNDDNRSAIFYNENIMDKWHSERVAVVKAMVHHLVSKKKSFVITKDTQLSTFENRAVHELLMPEVAVREILNKLIMPTTHSLGKIFSVPQDFVIERLEDNNWHESIAGYDF